MEIVQKKHIVTYAGITMQIPNEIVGLLKEKLINYDITPILEVFTKTNEFITLFKSLTVKQINEFLYKLNMSREYDFFTENLIMDEIENTIAEVLLWEAYEEIELENYLLNK